MIVMVRGTSGSGKTWVMRHIMSLAAGMWQPMYHRNLDQPDILPEFSGRKKPLFYRGHVSYNLFVLGHYEATCGGCDNIGSARAVYDVITALLRVYGESIILCEGLLLSEDTKWTAQLPDVRCVFLTTSIETCLKQVKARREEAGNEKPLNIENTVNRVATIERARRKLLAAGVTCRSQSARQAPDLILRWIAGLG